MKQRLKSEPNSEPLEELVELAPRSNPGDYDTTPIYLFFDRVVAVSTGFILGAGMADLYPEIIPESALGQIGLALLVEQGINGIQILNHFARPDGRTFKQRLKRSFRDDPYRIAGIYIGQLAARMMMY